MRISPEPAELTCEENSLRKQFSLLFADVEGIENRIIVGVHSFKIIDEKIKRETVDV